MIEVGGMLGCLPSNQTAMQVLRQQSLGVNPPQSDQAQN
jgi:hypothetical protein